MRLYLVHTMSVLRVDEHTFFRIAHQWAFGRMPDLSVDVREYKDRGEIPVYVQKYVRHIQQSEGERHAVSKM